MTQSIRGQQGGQPSPLVVSRLFPATPEQVFRAWTSAEHLRHWFCPRDYTVPQATIDFRVGGVFNLCMRSAEGVEHWSKGHYVEIVPYSRLVVELAAVDDHDRTLFRAHTVVAFSPVGDGTRMEVTQSYTLFEPLAARMIEGAPMGWNQTLDRLEREVERIKATGAAR